MANRYLPVWDFPGGSGIKNLPAHAGDLGLIPGWGRSPERGNGNPLQCSCLENPMDRGTWWATVYGAAESQTCLSTWQAIKVSLKTKFLYAHLYMFILFALFFAIQIC